MSATHADLPYAHRRSLNAHRWSKAQCRACVPPPRRALRRTAGRRPCWAAGRRPACSVRPWAGRLAGPAITSDTLRTNRCARCDTAWATLVATAPRLRAGAAALAAPEDGRALVARAACTELSARRSAAAAPARQLAPGLRAALAVLLLVGPWSGDPRQAAEEVSAPRVGAPLERFWPVAMPCARAPERRDACRACACVRGSRNLTGGTRIWKRLPSSLAR